MQFGMTLKMIEWNWQCDRVNFRALVLPIGKLTSPQTAQIASPPAMAEEED
jgi:hypothetical protein